MIFFDYRNEGEPSVVYQEDDDSSLSRVADSFDQFLEGFVEEL